MTPKDTVSQPAKVRNHSIDVWYSRPLDVHVWSEHKELNNIIDEVFDSLSDEQRLSISGRSKNKGRASGREHLKVVVLDLYVAWKTDPMLSIGVALGNGAYKVGSRYNALFISSRIRDVIHGLHAQEFIDLAKGSHNRTGTGKGNRTTRIRAAQRLVDLFNDVGLEPYELSLNHEKECVVLKDHDVDEFGEPIRRKGQKKSRDIEYQDTPETVRMREELRAYNALLAETYIDIPTLREPHIDRIKTDGTTQRVPIDQTNKFVRRIFSRGAWDMNGRFYGGWGQQVGKDLRRQIAINHLPTVEVDYKGLHVAILSAKKGVIDSPKDRYDLGTQILPQLDLKQQRAAVKQLVLTAINAKSEESAYLAFRHEQPKGSIEKRLEGQELNQLLQAFTKKHPHLEPDLCSDQGINLMYTDSQITEIILGKFTEMRKPVLSVHDSYIVQTTDVDLLKKAMSEASKKLTGVDLSVEQEIPSYDDIIRMRRVDRERYLDTLKEVTLSEKSTPEYHERLLRFMNYRKTNYESTYWLDIPYNHY